MQNQVKNFFLAVLFFFAFLNHFLSFFQIFMIENSILTNVMHISFFVLLILILERLTRKNQPLFLEFLNQFRSFSTFFLGVFLFFYVVFSMFFSLVQFKSHVTEYNNEYYVVSKNGIRKEKISKADYLIQKGSGIRIFESYWILTSYASIVVFMSKKPKKVLLNANNTDSSSSAS